MAVINPLQYLVNGVIENTPIGQTTPAAGTFTTLTANSTSQFGKSSANYWQATGAATTKGIQFQALGSDANISQVFQPKGTGAIDLAAGSSGVNISNGGTVTAITRTAPGVAYTSFPSIAISAPTTAGGVQATASVTGMTFYGTTPTINNGGTGYSVNDVLTVASGAVGGPCTLTVTSVSGGVITGVTHTAFGTLTTLPTVPYSVTGGTGTGATFTSTWQVASQAVTAAGSGYVEQPTVSFSGGGGSGAAAYATVGSGTIVRGLGFTMDFYNPAGLAFRVDSGSSYGANYWNARGNAVTPSLFASGTNGIIGTSGNGVLQFVPNNVEQFRVAPTASAVNYVQVTGSATGAAPAITAQGSDTNTSLSLSSKGITGSINLWTNNLGAIQFTVAHTASAVNRLQATGAAAGTAPVLSSIGTDTNIDLALTPKGTGVVQFGTYTASVLTPTGYITIKDSGGTTRRVLIG